MAKPEQKKCVLQRLEAEIASAMEIVTVVEEEILAATGTERRDLRRELAQRKGWLGQLRARRGQLRVALGLERRAPPPLTKSQAEEELAELLVAALLAVPQQTVRRWILDAEEQAQRERDWLEKARYEDQCAEYVVESTWRIAIEGRLHG
jgi:hypothetical protein